MQRARVTTVNFVLSDDKDEVIRMAKHLAAERIIHSEEHSPLQEFLGIKREMLESMRKNFDLLPDKIAEQATICGSFEDCINAIENLEPIGIDQICIRYPTEQSLRAIGKHIFPNLKIG